MTTRFNLFAATMALALFGCGGPPPLEISSAPLSGVMNGESWSLSLATTDAESSDALAFSARFVTGAPAEACTEAGFTPPAALLRVPTEVGSYDIDSTRSVTFAVFNVATGGVTNRTATDGLLEVSEIDAIARVVRGGMNVRIDDDNFLDGTFEMSICPPLEDQ